MNPNRARGLAWLRSLIVSGFHTTPLLIVMLALYGCELGEPAPIPAPPICNEQLTSGDVNNVVQQAVAQANALGEAVTIAVIDREGNNVGVFRMSGSNGSPGASRASAVTAAYLSSNQHGFTTVTACYIIQNHFPPGVADTPGGPLFGVAFSSIPGGDVQPNAGPLSDDPGGVPLFKGGCLVGAVGVSGGTSRFDKQTCMGWDANEQIAIGAAADYAVPMDKRGDNIFLDGIRLKFSENVEPARLTPVSGLSSFGSFTTSVPNNMPVPRFPDEGEVLLGNGFNFGITSGNALSSSEVNRIINQAVAQANRTRAAIRRPLGSVARVFIAVSDTNGDILGIWRTPDATFFSFDVAAQKARTAVAFSQPNTTLGRRIRAVLGLSPDAALAVTTRAVGFLAQDFYPPGIDRATSGRPVEAGPLFEGERFMFQQNIGAGPYGNGVQIFGGGIPLYKDGRLVGGVGVSGDGVEQDDLIAMAGAAGFMAPASIRTDQLLYHDVRLPFTKTPRNPEVEDDDGYGDGDGADE